MTSHNLLDKDWVVHKELTGFPGNRKALERCQGNVCFVPCPSGAYIRHNGEDQWIYLDDKAHLRPKYTLHVDHPNVYMFTPQGHAYAHNLQTDKTERLEVNTEHVVLITNQYIVRQTQKNTFSIFNRHTHQTVPLLFDHPTGFFGAYKNSLVFYCPAEKLIYIYNLPMVQKARTLAILENPMHIILAGHYLYLWYGPNKPGAILDIETLRYVARPTNMCYFVTDNVICEKTTPRTYIDLRSHTDLGSLAHLPVKTDDRFWCTGEELIVFGPDDKVTIFEREGHEVVSPIVSPIML